MYWNTSMALFQRVVTAEEDEEVVADVSTNQLRGYLYALPTKNKTAGQTALLSHILILISSFRRHNNNLHISPFTG